MLKKICIIPAYDRPEYLYLCLEKIVETNEYHDIKIIVSLDLNYNPNNLDVIDKFNNILNITLTSNNINVSNKEMKQSFHLLSAYKKYYNMHKPDLIYMIEDDIIISKDFFSFHEDIHKLHSNTFVSIVSEPNNFKGLPGSNNDIYHSPMSDYQSLGVCFNANKLNEFILCHNVSEYYKNPNHYLLNKFPNSKYNNKWWEQDGMIRRVLESLNVTPIYACTPRCYHAGYYGYHRPGNRPNGTLNEKINELRNIIFNQELLNSKQEVYKDSFICNLNTSHDKLNLIKYES